ATGARMGGLTDTGPGAARPSFPPKALPGGEHSFAVCSVAFSPDGATLAAAGTNGVIRLWDISSGAVRHRFSGHLGAAHRLAFPPDGRTVASRGDDKTVRLWHLQTGQQLFTLATHTEPLHGLAFSGDGRLLLAGAWTRGGDGPSALLLWGAEPAGP